MDGGGTGSNQQFASVNVFEQRLPVEQAGGGEGGGGSAAIGVLPPPPLLVMGGISPGLEMGGDMPPMAGNMGMNMAMLPPVP